MLKDGEGEFFRLQTYSKSCLLAAASVNIEENAQFWLLDRKRTVNERKKDKNKDKVQKLRRKKSGEDIKERKSGEDKRKKKQRR